MEMIFIVTKLVHIKKQYYEIHIKFPNGSIHKEQVHEEIVLKYRLVAGKELTEEQMSELKSRMDYGEVYQAAMRMVSHKLYTLAELSKKLKEREYKETTIDEVLYKLNELRLLDDEKYAISYINHHQALGKKGPDLIKRDLISKGVAKKIIDRHLETYDEESSLTHAIKLASSQIRKNNKYGLGFLRPKVIQYLQQKGFPSDISKQAVEEALKENREDESDILLDQTYKLYKKYSRYPEYEGKQKIIQALGRKGFSYDEAKRAYNEVKEEV